MMCADREMAGVGAKTGYDLAEVEFAVTSVISQHFTPGNTVTDFARDEKTHRVDRKKAWVIGLKHKGKVI